MNELKICSKCQQSKASTTEYYLCSGRWRSECKVCTIKRNVKYQKKTKAWKHRYVDDDTRRLYMREYYAKNKGKFAHYRSEFSKRHPDYYKAYFRNRKEKK
jgi:hypothetical protein